jgi:hypothetical protein
MENRLPNRFDVFDLSGAYNEFPLRQFLAYGPDDLHPIFGTRKITQKLIYFTL